jgi:hypothetical protein
MENDKPWNWNKVHSSHKMKEKEGGAILCPTGTPRFYGLRKCTVCGFEQAEHPAGKFMDYQLKRKCGKKKTKDIETVIDSMR